LKLKKLEERIHELERILKEEEEDESEGGQYNKKRRDADEEEEDEEDMEEMLDQVDTGMGFNLFGKANDAYGNRQRPKA